MKQTVMQICDSYMNIYIYIYPLDIYIYISKGLQCALTAITIVALWQLPHLGHGIYIYIEVHNIHGIYIYIYMKLSSYAILHFLINIEIRFPIFASSLVSITVYHINIIY